MHYKWNIAAASSSRHKQDYLVEPWNAGARRRRQYLSSLSVDNGCYLPRVVGSRLIHNSARNEGRGGLSESSEINQEFISSLRRIHCIHWRKVQEFQDWIGKDGWSCGRYFQWERPARRGAAIHGQLHGSGRSFHRQYCSNLGGRNENRL